MHSKMVLGTNWGDLAALRSEFGVSGMPRRMHQPWDARVTASAVKGHHREFRKFQPTTIMSFLRILTNRLSTVSSGVYLQSWQPISTKLTTECQ